MVAALDVVVDGREGDRDVLAGLGALDPEGGHQLGGEHLLGAARAHVVDLAEEDGVVARRLHVDGDRGRAGDAEAGGEGGRVERGVLAGEVEGDADAQGGELGQAAGAAQARQGRDRGRAGTGRVGEGLLAAAGQGERARVALQARVGAAARAAQQGGAVRGVDASGAGDAERGPGVGVLVVLQVPVEPGRHACLDAAGLHVAAVMAAGDPVDVHGGAVRADRLLRRVGLAEREEGVRLALEQEGRHVDTRRDGRRGAGLQECAGLGIRLAGLGDAVVHLAQRGLELGAAAAGVDEDAGPELLEDVVREQGVREVPVRDRRGDRVDPVVVTGGQEGDRASVGTSRHAHARVARFVEFHVRLLRQPVDQLRYVLDLARRVVQADLAGGFAEAPGGPGQYRVAVAGQVLGFFSYVFFAAAEAVRKEDGRAAGRSACREVRSVQFYAVDRHRPVRLVDRGPGVRGRGRPGACGGQYDDRGGGCQPAPGVLQSS